MIVSFLLKTRFYPHRALRKVDILARMAKNKFSKQWLFDHLNDPYVKLATKHGYRARAAFKLIEIDAQDKLIKPGMTIVDLGSAPGSWSQVLRERLAKTGEPGLNGRVIALDLLPMDPVEGIDFILGDFREQAVSDQLAQLLNGALVDLVVSDMAPNLSGVEGVDSARMEHLAELAVEFSHAHLKPSGALLIKCFHGSGYSQIVKFFQANFVQVGVRKPKSSRDKSKETFLLGRGLKGVPASGRLP
jgi:23S rRNA (uridine2552-2'-O)-methyltransferase